MRHNATYRKTVLVPVTTMVEAQLPTDEEKQRLLASLAETEAQFARGDFEVYREAGFLPNLRAGYPPSLLTPAVVADRSDGQLVHLDGLNLSRAWCMWAIAATLPAGDPRRAVLTQAAERHAAAGLTGVDSGDYMGDHWLATFALMMLECAPQT